MNCLFRRSYRVRPPQAYFGLFPQAEGEPTPATPDETKSCASGLFVRFTTFRSSARTLIKERDKSIIEGDEGTDELLRVGFREQQWKDKASATRSHHEEH